MYNKYLHEREITSMFIAMYNVYFSNYLQSEELHGQIYCPARPANRCLHYTLF